MYKSFFDSLNVFIRRRYRWVIIAWAVVVLLSLVLIPSFFSAVSYDIMGSVGATPNSESQTVSNILHAEFPEFSNKSESINHYCRSRRPVYSDSLKDIVLELNGTLSKDKSIINYTNASSLYSLEYSLLNSSLPDIVTKVGSLKSNITSINSGLYTLKQNMSSLSISLFQLEDGINQTSQLIYGVPTAFIGVWQGIIAQGVPDPYVANYLANDAVFNLTSNFGGDAQAIGYYTVFFNAWNSTFGTLPNNATVLEREALAINQSVSLFLSNTQLDTETSQVVSIVASGLNVANWNDMDSIANLAISSIAQNIPSELMSSLGITPMQLVSQLDSMGPSPSNATLPTALSTAVAGTGASPQVAAAFSHTPAAGALFAAFLGYNPIGTLLQTMSPTVVAALPQHTITVLEGQTFFPNAIASPFMSALTTAFIIAAALCILAAVFSAMPGKKNHVMRQ